MYKLMKRAIPNGKMAASSAFFNIVLLFGLLNDERTHRYKKDKSVCVNEYGEAVRLHFPRGVALQPMRKRMTC